MSVSLTFYRSKLFLCKKIVLPHLNKNICSLSISQFFFSHHTLIKKKKKKGVVGELIRTGRFFGNKCYLKITRIALPCWMLISSYSLPFLSFEKVFKFQCFDRSILVFTVIFSIFCVFQNIASMSQDFSNVQLMYAAVKW